MTRGGRCGYTGSSASAGAGSVLKRRRRRTHRSNNRGFIPSNDGRASKNTITSDEVPSSVLTVMSNDDSNEVPSSVLTVMSNDDLLIEILLRLPILSLYFFKSVSNRWLSLIKRIDSTHRRTQTPSLDPPSGVFIRRFASPCVYDFVSFDSRIPSRIHPSPSAFTFRLNSEIRFVIIESCNGLLLCQSVTNEHRICHDMFCVYNPSVNLLKMLPKCHDPNLTEVEHEMKIAFDPRISPHYKIVLTACVGHFNKIEIYSSETRNWSVCGIRFPWESFVSFDRGLYCNHAIHWLNYGKDHMHFKLDIVNEQPILTNIQLPVTSYTKMYWDCKLFESCGCLLLLDVDYTHSQQFNMYEMKNESSEWSLKYIVKLDDIEVPFPEWGCSHVRCIVLSQSEEDSFMVIRLDNRIVEYKILSKNHRDLYDRRLSDPSDYFPFIASSAGV